MIVCGFPSIFHCISSSCLFPKLLISSNPPSLFYHLSLGSFLIPIYHGNPISFSNIFRLLSLKHEIPRNLICIIPCIQIYYLSSNIIVSVFPSSLLWNPSYIQSPPTIARNYNQILLGFHVNLLVFPSHMLRDFKYYTPSFSFS